MNPHTAAAAPRLSSAKLVAAAVAMSIGALLMLTTSAPAAKAEGVARVSGSWTSLHDGVDWSGVAAAPVSTGATVGAYDR
jgi:hypothetical protein